MKVPKQHSSKQAEPQGSVKLSAARDTDVCAPDSATASAVHSNFILSVFFAPGNDPFTNLAYERFLLDCVGERELILMLWVNNDTIVLGRNQNAYKECRVEEFERDGGHIARRLSGGGAVYHDLGNLNFSFIARDAVYNETRQMNIVCAALRSFGLNAHIDGRNDLSIDAAKFSGSAFFHSKKAHCHHGTLMVQVNEQRLSRYLVADKRKLASKGVSSLRSRVRNLRALCPSLSVDALSRALIEAAQDVCVSMAGTDKRVDVNLVHLPDFLDEPVAIWRKKFADKTWRLGTKYTFTHHIDERFSWGSVDIELDVRENKVQRAQIYSDALDAELIDKMRLPLQGLSYEPELLSAALVNNHELLDGEATSFARGHDFQRDSHEARVQIIKDCAQLLRRCV